MSIDVAILGATGVVGQKAIALLQNSSIFVVRELVASDQHLKKTYAEAVNWREPLMPLPEAIGKIRLSSNADIKSTFIISCLPSHIAKVRELELAKNGKIVFSNACAFRMERNIPLMIPEINADHLELIHDQPTPGKIITNPNCSTVFTSLALAPLMSLGKIKHVSVVTLQSASGAGFPGVASLDLLANTIPFIEGEAEKITQETKKILGSLNVPADLAITAQVHRVPVLYGHTITLHVTFEQEINLASAIESYQTWNEKFPNLFKMHSNVSHPQPLKDLSHDDQRVHLGNIKIGDRGNVLSLVALGNNLVKGAAGAAIENMRTYLNVRDMT